MLSAACATQKKVSQAALAASLTYEQAVQTQFVATIADTYYSLVALDKQLAVRRQSSGMKTCTMQALKRAGEQTEAAVAQAKASLLEAESSVLMLEKQIYELETHPPHCWASCRRRYGLGK